MLNKEIENFIKSNKTIKDFKINNKDFKLVKLPFEGDYFELYIFTKSPYAAFESVSEYIGIMNNELDILHLKYLSFNSKITSLIGTFEGNTSISNKTDFNEIVNTAVAQFAIKNPHFFISKESIKENEEQAYGLFSKSEINQYSKPPRIGYKIQNKEVDVRKYAKDKDAFLKDEIIKTISKKQKWLCKFLSIKNIIDNLEENKDKKNDIGFKLKLLEIFQQHKNLLLEYQMPNGDTGVVSIKTKNIPGIDLFKNNVVYLNGLGNSKSGAPNIIPYSCITQIEHNGKNILNKGDYDLTQTDDDITQILLAYNRPEYLAKEKFYDRKIAMKAVSGLYFDLIPEDTEFRKDKEFIKECSRLANKPVKKLFYEWIDDSLKIDTDFLEKWCGENWAKDIFDISKIDKSNITDIKKFEILMNKIKGEYIKLSALYNILGTDLYKKEYVDILSKNKVLCDEYVLKFNNDFKFLDNICIKSSIYNIMPKLDKATLELEDFKEFLQGWEPTAKEIIDVGESGFSFADICNNDSSYLLELIKYIPNKSFITELENKIDFDLEDDEKVIILATYNPIFLKFLDQETISSFFECEFDDIKDIRTSYDKDTKMPILQIESEYMTIEMDARFIKVKSNTGKEYNSLRKSIISYAQSNQQYKNIVQSLINYYEDKNPDLIKTAVKNTKKPVEPKNIDFDKLFSNIKNYNSKIKTKDLTK